MFDCGDTGAKGGVLYVQDLPQMLEQADHSAFHAFIEEIRAAENQPLVTVVTCGTSDLARVRKVATMRGEAGVALLSMTPTTVCCAYVCGSIFPTCAQRFH